MLVHRLIWLRQRGLPLIGLVTVSSCAAFAQTIALDPQGISLELSSGSVIAGSATDLNLFLKAPGAKPPASVQWTVHYEVRDFSSVTIDVSPRISQLDKALSCEASPGSMTCVLWGLNDAPLSNGVIATLRLTAAAMPANRAAPIELVAGASAGIGGEKLATTLRSGSVRLLPRLDGLSCDALNVTGSTGSTCSVAIAPPAPSGGVIIALSASPAALTIPASVTIPEGANSATFVVVLQPVSTAAIITLTAFYCGVGETFDITAQPSNTLTSMPLQPGQLIAAPSRSSAF